MMIQTLKYQWKYGNSFTCLELSTVSGEGRIFGVKAQKRRDEFMRPHFFETSSIAALTDELSSGQHVQLIINTDQVLIKEVPKGDLPEKLVSRAFPSLSLSGFYFEMIPSANGYFIAVCRKDYVEKILAQCTAAKLCVVGFRLGFGSLGPLLQLIKSSEIHTARRTFQQVEDGILSFTETEKATMSYEIDDIKVPYQFLLPLSGLFGYTYIADPKVHNYASKNEGLARFYSEKNFFKKTLTTAVAGFLVLLLMNFLFYSNYYNTYNALEEELQILQNNESTFRAKFDAVAAKEQRVFNIFNSGNSNSSYYINRIAKNKPNTVLFSEIQYQPLYKRIKVDKRVEYKVNEMIIKGESNDKGLFSKWIEQLEQLEWIDEVTILGYGKQQKDTDDFELLIQLDDEAKV